MAPALLVSVRDPQSIGNCQNSSLAGFRSRLRLQGHERAGLDCGLYFETEADMADGKWIAYPRVSTDRQGRSVFGLEAQRASVTDFLNGGHWKLVKEVCRGRARPSRPAGSTAPSS